MRRIGWITGVVVVAIVVAWAQVCWAAGPIKASLGIRWKEFELTGDKNFVGSITADTVKEKTQWFPTNVNLQLLWCPYGGFAFEVDHFTSEMERDGKLQWFTINLEVVGRYPIAKRFIPYAVAGVCLVDARFEENKPWYYGFPSIAAYNNWVAAQPPGVSRKDWIASYTGYRRQMIVDDTVGWLWGIGMDIMLTKHLALNFDMRWYYAEVDVRFVLQQGGGTIQGGEIDFTYPLDTQVYSVGLRWYF